VTVLIFTHFYNQVINLLKNVTFAYQGSFWIYLYIYVLRNNIDKCSRIVRKGKTYLRTISLCVFDKYDFFYHKTVELITEKVNFFQSISRIEDKKKTPKYYQIT